MKRNQRLLILSLVPALALGQEKSEMQQIMERLERLEEQNRALAAEVHSLRDELVSARGTPGQPVAPTAAQAAAPETAPLDERVAVVEQRTADLQQSKVESSQKLPLSITGMFLFNAFLNGKASAGIEYPTAASRTTSDMVGGASLAQTVLGLKYQGPHIFGGGQVSGSLFMDFFGGTNQSLNHLLRIRVASLEINWKNQTFMVGQDKPIISPREPNSLAQVGFSPLTANGNLWLWQPQARFEQRFSLGEQTGLRAQVGVYETRENYLNAPVEYDASMGAPRPGMEGRFELWHDFGGGRRVELAPGFHTSSSHVGERSVPSNIFSFDWLIRPWSRVDFTGMFFQGENVSTVGGLQQGIDFGPRGYLRPVHAVGGWGQVAYRITERLSFNVYGGEEDDRNSDLVFGSIGRNMQYAGNIIYRLGPNVLVGLEASQVRTTYLGPGLQLNNHYDVALAYLF
jgi:hypothetical protein